MAKIRRPLKNTLKHEGGYVNDPDDTGGETIFGIARNKNSKWQGWGIVDGYKKQGQLSNIVSIFKQGYWPLVEELYKKKYWDKCKLDLIGSQNVANQIFDMSVNHGSRQAVRFLQRGYNDVTGKDTLVVDGLIGKNTIRHINSMNMTGSTALCNKLVKTRIDFYWNLYYRKAVYIKYINGWCKRALSFIVK